MLRFESLLGEMTQKPAEGLDTQYGAFHSAWNGPEPDAVRAPLAMGRPSKKRSGCKTCDGRGCVGRCRF